MYRWAWPKLLRSLIVLVMIAGVICRGMCLPMPRLAASGISTLSSCGMVMPMNKHDQSGFVDIHRHLTQIHDETPSVHWISTFVFLLFWLLSLVQLTVASPRPEPCPLRFPPPRLRYMRFQE